MSQFQRHDGSFINKMCDLCNSGKNKCYLITYETIFNSVVPHNR